MGTIEYGYSQNEGFGHCIHRSNYCLRIIRNKTFCFRCIDVDDLNYVAIDLHLFRPWFGQTHLVLDEITWILSGLYKAGQLLYIVIVG